MFQLHCRDLSIEHWRVCLCELCSRHFFCQLQCIVVIDVCVLSCGLLFAIGRKRLQRLRKWDVSAKCCLVGVFELFVGLVFSFSRRLVHELCVGHVSVQYKLVELFELRRRKLFHGRFKQLH